MGVRYLPNKQCLRTKKLGGRLRFSVTEFLIFVGSAQEPVAPLGTQRAEPASEIVALHRRREKWVADQRERVPVGMLRFTESWRRASFTTSFLRLTSV